MKSVLIQHAQELLTKSTGHSIRLINPQTLSDQNTVLRCQLEPAPPGISSSVILKQVTTTKFNNPDGPVGESHRFLNEWACLSFLSNLPGKSHYGPQLLASDREISLIILEDFGDHPTVQDILLGNNRDAAKKALNGIGTFLGQMQAATYGRVDEFTMEQFRLKAASPHSDSTIDFRNENMIEV